MSERLADVEQSVRRISRFVDMNLRLLGAVMPTPETNGERKAYRSVREYIDRDAAAALEKAKNGQPWSMPASDNNAP